MSRHPKPRPGALKGDIGGECKRGDCSGIAALWFNAVTNAHYCQRCAVKINRSCVDSGQKPICEKILTAQEAEDLVRLPR